MFLLFTIRRLIFPAISTGVYGYPIKKAAEVSFKTIKEFCKGNSNIKEIKIILFRMDYYDMYKKIIENIFG